MANKTIQFRYTPGITTLFINVYSHAGGSPLNLSGPLPCVADSTQTSLYKAVMSDAASGAAFNVDILNGSTVIGSGLCDLAEAVGNFDVFEGPTVGQVDARVKSNQMQSSNLAGGGSSLKVVASSFVLTAGVAVSGTYANTAILDGTYHILGDNGDGNVDAYYEFTFPQSMGTLVQFEGYVTRDANRSYVVQAYNYVNSTWDQIGAVTTATSVLDQLFEFPLTNQHTSTGHVVRIRFLGVDVSNYDLVIDRLLVGFSVSNTSTLSDSDLAAIASSVSTNLASIKTIEVVNTPVCGTDYELISGDDYYQVDGRAIPTTITDTMPDFTGASIVLHVQGLSFTAVHVSDTGSTRVFYFEFSSAQTAAFDIGIQLGYILVTLFNGHKLTPIKAKLTVKPRG